MGDIGRIMMRVARGEGLWVWPCAVLYWARLLIHSAATTKDHLRGLSRRGAGVVERGGLENRCAGNSTQSSNLCLSAIF